MVEAIVSQPCITCHTDKPLDAFPIIRKRGRTYYRHQCKACAETKRVRVFRSSRSRPSVQRQTGMKICTGCRFAFPMTEFGWHEKGHRIANSKCHPCQQAYKREYDPVYYQRNRLKRHNQRQEKRVEIAAYNGIQRAKRTNPNADYVDYTAIVERDGSTCYLCFCQLLASEISFDHIVPLSRGGKHAANNIKVCCESCNCRKQAKLPSEL